MVSSSPAAIKPTQREESTRISSISASSESHEPGREQIFEILSNERRRYILAYLQQRGDGTADIGELASHVTAMENEISIDEITSSQRKSVYVGLRQSHLPKMDAYNLLEYDADRGTVELTDAAEEAKMYLEYVPKHDIPWAVHYLGITALLAGILVLNVFEAYPFDGLDGTMIAALTLLVVGVSAGVHALYTRKNKLEDIYEFDH